MRKLLNEELDRKTAEEFKKAEKTPIILILDQVRSMNNVGSVFRTADAFLIEAVYLCGFTPTPPHREIQKTALGATETVHWKQFTSTVEAVTELKSQGWNVYAVEQTEQSIFLDQFEAKQEKKIALVFGNEVEGVSQEVIDLCKATIEIDQRGTKHSLNIAVSAGIVVWEIWKQLK
jgi:23S rRNA (guanosine2251-2'-O)-methyltransferase